MPILATVNAPVKAAADYARMVSGIAGLQEENARLAEENNRLREWYQKALVLEAENSSLQKMLNITLAPQHTYVTARIIADPGNSYVRTLLVMAGRDSGVEKGQAVLAGDGLAGRIIEAGAKASRVLLLSDMSSRIPVVLEGSDYHAIMAGNNSERPVLERLPRDSEIREGMRVVTSGNGGYFPYGLPVGRVARAGDGKWIVIPFADPDRLTFVRIVNSVEDLNLLKGKL